MNQNAIHQLDMFLEDIGFPTDKEGLVLESLDSPLSSHVRDAIALLPEGEYMTREDVRRELIGLPDSEADKKLSEDDEDEMMEIKEENENVVEIEIIETEEDKQSERSK